MDGIIYVCVGTCNVKNMKKTNDPRIFSRFKPSFEFNVNLYGNLLQSSEKKIPRGYSSGNKQHDNYLD